MLEQTRYEKAFSTPIFRFHVEDHGSLNEALLLEAERMRSVLEGTEKSNKGGWHSAGNLFDEGAPALKTVETLAARAVWSANESIRAKARPKDLSLKLFGWMNINPKQTFNAPHSHPGAHWSGVYYVSVPKTDSSTSGKLEFVSPRADLADWRLLNAPAFKLKKGMNPSEGEIILFPSYLVHWVYPNETDDERVSIAFNATFSKAGK